MSTTTPVSQKRTAHPLDHLDYNAKTARRVAWEAFEFTITSPGQVEVANASYGHLKADHTYTVTIEDVDGVALPTECDCPADQHQDSDCKHKVALANIGGPIILNAALNATPCLAGLPACSGPVSGKILCFECYSAREKAARR